MNVLVRNYLLIFSILDWAVTLAVLIKAWGRLGWVPIEMMVAGAVLVTSMFWLIRKTDETAPERRFVAALFVMQIFVALAAGARR